MIKLCFENFEVLPTHPSQYGETEVLKIKIDLVDLIQITSETIESRSEG